MNNFADQMNKLTDLLQNKMLYAQALQEYHVNKEWTFTYNFKPENKIYLSTWNLKMQQFVKKLNWKFTKQLIIRWKMSFYTYEFKLSSEMKVHSTFHISLLQLLKDDLIDRQVLSLQLMIVENEENSYFIDSINNMKWNMKFTWFELLIKWEEYEQKTWNRKIKKNLILIMVKNHIMKHDANMKILKFSM